MNYPDWQPMKTAPRRPPDYYGTSGPVILGWELVNELGDGDVCRDVVGTWVWVVRRRQKAGAPCPMGLGKRAVPGHKKKTCDGSPYEQAAIALYGWSVRPFDLGYRQVWRHAAQKELDFLVSLREPVEGAMP